MSRGMREEARPLQFHLGLSGREEGKKTQRLFSTIFPNPSTGRTTSVLLDVLKDQCLMAPSL